MRRKSYKSSIFFLIKYNNKMFYLVLMVVLRIFSNSFINVFQKILTNNRENSSIINFYTYLGLAILGAFFVSPQGLNPELLIFIIIMGVLGALGNYFIIKALSLGELSTLAPINSYKPVVALFLAWALIHEIPTAQDTIGILLIICGTFLLGNSKTIYSKATSYRFLALIFSASEAIFIKKIILLTNVLTAFSYWAIAGFLFSYIFALLSKHPIRLKSDNIKYLMLLIFSVAVMQITTNYVFSIMNVAYALALFQLSTIVSVFAGVNIFKEKGLSQKLLASFVMIIGAVVIILKNS